MACEFCVGKDGKVWAPFKGSAPKGVSELWPENFVEESGGCGTYYCPTCRGGLDEARARQAEVTKLDPDSDPAVSAPALCREDKSESHSQSNPNEYIFWLIGFAAYICAIFYVWSLNPEIGRWMLLATPLLVLVAGAYYFAEGETSERRNSNFAINLQVVTVSLVALWLLAQCSPGSGDGPIDSFFKR